VCVISIQVTICNQFGSDGTARAYWMFNIAIHGSQEVEAYPADTEHVFAVGQGLLAKAICRQQSESEPRPCVFLEPTPRCMPQPGPDIGTPGFIHNLYAVRTLVMYKIWNCSDMCHPVLFLYLHTVM
jgi:hypothetical protein